MRPAPHIFLCDLSTRALRGAASASDDHGMPTDTHVRMSGRSVGTYVVLSLLLAVTYAAIFFNAVFTLFAYSSCGRPVASEVREGRFLLFVAVVVVAAIW